MASPIFVTPSTTLVEVATVDLGAVPVILNPYSYTGQVVTVLDATSSFGVLQSSIVVSTAAMSQFSDGSISTLINQPQGYVTAQSVAPNQWWILNSFPFRNQYLSAGTQVTTVSSFAAAAISTLQENTSSLVVENLLVSGNLSQSSGLTLNQTISSFGSVDFYSTVTIWDNAFFSSQLSTVGSVRLASSLTVDGSLITPSAIQLLSSAYVSTSVSVVGFLSTSLLSLSGGLDTYRLISQESTIDAVNVAGSLNVLNWFNALSSLQVGSTMTLQTTQAGQFSTLSSFALWGSLTVSQEMQLLSSLSTQGALVVHANLSTGTDTLVEGALIGQSNLTVGKSTLVSGFVSTQNLFVSLSSFFQGGLQVDVSTPTVVEKTTVTQSFGFADLQAVSTTIGGILSTPTNVWMQGTAGVGDRMDVKQEISTIGSVSTFGSLFALGGLSAQALFVSGNMTIYDGLSVLSTSYWNESRVSTASIEGTLTIQGNLTVTQTMTLSSFSLAMDTFANNFQVSSLKVLSILQGTGTALISTVETSSLVTGGQFLGGVNADMRNILKTMNLSTFQLSSLEFRAETLGSFGNNTFFQATSSFGVQRTANLSFFDVQPIAYTLCNMIAEKNVSTQAVYANTITGILSGDGRLLSNVSYPQRISTSGLETSTLITSTMFTSTMFASTLNTSLFTVQSTLQVGTFHFLGNAAQTPFTNQTFLATVTNSPNVMLLNNLLAFGNSAGTANKQVSINKNGISTTNTLYAMEVNGTMRINNIVSPNFRLPLRSYVGDQLTVADLFSTNSFQLSTGNTFISTSLLLLSTGESYATRSTNILQPVFSTLAFNSTLFVNQELGRVGINTSPFYTLDVHESLYVPTSLTTIPSTIIRDQVVVKRSQSNVWYGVGVYEAGVASNIRISYDGLTWFPYSGSNGAPTSDLNSIAYNGGNTQINSLQMLQDQSFWVATGINTILSIDQQRASTQTFEYVGDCEFTSVAYNGQYWIAGCLSPLFGSFGSFTTSATLVWSSDGRNWSNSITGGFGFGTVNNQHGCRGVAWNGYQWVAVGIGSNAANTIQASKDGSNWSNAVTGGFGGSNGAGCAVVWADTKWIVVGTANENFILQESSNGYEWTTIITTLSGTGFEPTSLAWNGSRLVMVGNLTVYSDNYGSNWTLGSGDIFTQYDPGLVVVWNGEYWLGGGAGIRKSLDGITWITSPSIPNSVVFKGLAYSSNAVPSLTVGTSTVQTLTKTIAATSFSLAFGDSLTTGETILTSTDGSNWTPATSGSFSIQARAAAYGTNSEGDAYWIAAGDGGGSLKYSADGSNWSDVTSPPPEKGYAITYGTYCNTGYWVSGHLQDSGSNGTIYYSSLGRSNWSAPFGSFESACYGIAHNTSGNFVAVGENSSSSSNTIYYSSNGPTSFINSGVSGSFQTAGYGIAYALNPLGGGLFVAVGSNASNANTIKYATDSIGMSWTDAGGSLFSGAGYGVAYNGSNQWVAVGESTGSGGTIKYSSDGQTWSAATSGEFTGAGYGINYNSALGLWIATGTLESGAAVKYSGDGQNWSDATGTAFQTNGYGAASRGTTYTGTRSYYNQIRFYNSPFSKTLERDGTPFISYTPSTLNLNNTVLFDSNQNILVGTQNGSAYQSTFIQAGTMRVTGTLQTNSVIFDSGLYFEIDTV